MAAERRRDRPADSPERPRRGESPARRAPGARARRVRPEEAGTGPRRIERVHVAADAVQAEAIRLALIKVGIAAQIVIEDDGAGGVTLEIFAPLAQAPLARQLIADGHWPRLA